MSKAAQSDLEPSAAKTTPCIYCDEPIANWRFDPDIAVCDPCRDGIPGYILPVVPDVATCVHCGKLVLADGQLVLCAECVGEVAA